MTKTEKLKTRIDELEAECRELMDELNCTRNSLEKLEHEIEILQERQDPIEDLMRRLDLIPGHDDEQNLERLTEAIDELKLAVRRAA
jgi:chromosome segregation ATPase